MDAKGVYAFSTVLRSKEIVGKVVRMERTIRFRAIEGLDDSPDKLTISHVRDALEAFKDYGAASDCDACELVLKTSDLLKAPAHVINQPI